MKYDLIDISNYQDVYDLGAVYSEVECVYHHAVQGGWVNPWFGPRRDWARNLGKPFGAYLFLVPGDINHQVSLFTQVVGELSATDPRPMLDIEHSGLTTIDVRTAMEGVMEWTGGISPLGYGGMNVLCPLAKHDPALLQMPLWFAWYPDDANTVARIMAQFTRLRLGGFSTDPWENPTIWQYGSQGTVAGITGRVDTNLFWKGYSLNDILIQAPQPKDSSMYSVVPDWITNPVEGSTSHYRVVNSITGALFQAKGDCQVKEAAPDSEGITSIALGVTIDKITGISMGDRGRQVIVTGYDWNTWNFHTNGENPPDNIDLDAVTEHVLKVEAQRLVG